MKDIRRDLKERLIEIAAQRKHHQGQLENLVKQESLLKNLLELEEMRWVSQKLPLFGTQATHKLGNGKPHTPLAQFILNSLVSGRKPLQTLKN